MSTLIKNGTIVSGSGCFPADLLIEGEKIKALYSPDRSQDLADYQMEVVDASGCYLFPGFIDAHTHFDLHVAGTVTADDFYTGSKAAIKGGTTTVLDFATQYSGESLAEALKNWHQKADDKSSCDYSFHMSVSEWNDDVEKEMDLMMEEGITSFKLYLTYDIKVDDKTLYKILKCLKRIHGIVGVHCENDGLIAALQEEAIAGRKTGVDNHFKTRPAEAEAEAIDRLLRIAKVVDVPVVIVHISTEAGYKVVEAARASGQTVFVETCPQYLLLDDSLYCGSEEQGRKYICAPPLRKTTDSKYLWKGIASSGIQTVCTDHCSFTTAQKALGKDDFRKIPGGLAGVETRGILMYTYGVDKGLITLSDMCRILSENQAKLYGLYPRKGLLAPGSDADIVVLRANVSDTISADSQLQNIDYAPFEGWKSTGRIETVYLRGTKVFDGGKLLKENHGQFVKRGTWQDL